jgi:aspartate/methionine/tyrosine aminotransferase
VPLAGQLAAVTALRQSETAFAPVREAFADRRRYAVERLTACGLTPELPGGGLAVWLPVGSLGLTGRAFADRLYAEQRVLVTPGDLSGPGGDGHVRLSFAADDGRLRAGLGRVAEFAAALRPADVSEPVVSESPAEPAAVG